MLLYSGRKRNRTRKNGPRLNSARKLRLFFRLLIIFIFLLFLVNGVIKSEQLAEFLFSPLTGSQKVKELYGGSTRFDGETKINAVVDGDPVLVVSFDPYNRTIKILAIPASTYAQVAGGYGWYPLGSAFGLGQLEQSPAGGLTLLRTTSDLLAVPIDYYLKFAKPIKTDKESVEQYKRRFGGIGMLWFAFQAPQWLKQNLDTNLTLFEIYRLWWQARFVRNQNFSYLDVKADILENLLLPDGSFGYTPKKDQLDLLSEKVFEDSKIQSEGLSIEVLNSTTSVGLATQTQRLLENIGCNVVNVGNYETAVGQSLLVVNNPQIRDSYTVKRLAGALHLTVKEGFLPDSTADLTIILGNNEL